MRVIRGETIRNILIIAETHSIAGCIINVLHQDGYTITSSESADIFSNLFLGDMNALLTLVIVTNNTLTPKDIREIIPHIKKNLPGTSILVLSGYDDDGFSADLKKSGANVFLRLPFDETVLQREVQSLIHRP